MSFSLLHIPTRTTDETDFSTGFKSFILNNYEQDPEKFKTEIATLSRLRQDVRGAGKDLTGRDILYRYFGQLEFLDSRFPIDDQNVKVLFTWYDAFTQEEASQHSIAFEKASILFNLAATCTSIAAFQDRNTTEGISIAFKYLQAAAFWFSYINENFLHAPSIDMSRDSIKTLTELALAQSQEVVIEKQINFEKKKGALVSKLCAHLSNAYSNVLDGFNLQSVKGQFDKAWLEFIKVKAKYYLSLAYFHKCVHLETDSHYGTSIAHLAMSETLAKESSKLASSFAYQFPKFTTSTMTNNTTGSKSGNQTSVAVTSLVELCKLNLKLISDKLVILTKDNDMIYHDHIPLADSLEPLEKLNIVKPVPFSDLFINKEADTNKLIGPPIFAKLVPNETVVASSVYSEEKAKLFRKEQAAAKNAQDEFSATLESLSLLKTLEKIKIILKDTSKMGEEWVLTSEIIDGSLSIQSDEAKNSKVKTEDLIMTINNLKADIKSLFAEVSQLLDKEQHECETMRVKYLDSWSQEPSSSVTSIIRAEVKSHKESFEKADPLDNPIVENIHKLSHFSQLLNQPLDKVEAEYFKEVAKLSNLESNFDVNESINDQLLVAKIEALIGNVNNLKKERDEILGALSAKIQKDDITQNLVSVKNHDDHSKIFQMELKKYSELQLKLQNNISRQKDLINDLTLEFKKLCDNSEVMRIIKNRDLAKAKISNEWTELYKRYKISKDGLKNGWGFYLGLHLSVSNLKEKVIKYVNQRSEESNALAKRIEDSLAEKGQRAIRDQLQKLSVHENDMAVQNIPTYSPAGVQPQLNREQNYNSVQYSSPLDKDLRFAGQQPSYNENYSPKASLPPGTEYPSSAYVPFAPPSMSPGQAEPPLYNANQGALYFIMINIIAPAYIPSNPGEYSYSNIPSSFGVMKPPQSFDTRAGPPRQQYENEIQPEKTFRNDFINHSHFAQAQPPQFYQQSLPNQNYPAPQRAPISMKNIQSEGLGIQDQRPSQHRPPILPPKPASIQNPNVGNPSTMVHQTSYNNPRPSVSYNQPPSIPPSFRPVNSYESNQQGPVMPTNINYQQRVEAQNYDPRQQLSNYPQRPPVPSYDSRIHGSNYQSMGNPVAYEHQVLGDPAPQLSAYQPRQSAPLNYTQRPIGAGLNNLSPRPDNQYYSADNRASNQPSYPVNNQLPPADFNTHQSHPNYSYRPTGTEQYQPRPSISNYGPPHPAQNYQQRPSSDYYSQRPPNPSYDQRNFPNPQYGNQQTGEFYQARPQPPYYNQAMPPQNISQLPQSQGTIRPNGKPSGNPYSNSSLLD